MGSFALPSYDNDPIGGAWLADRALLDELGWAPAATRTASASSRWRSTCATAPTPAPCGPLRRAGLDVESPVPGPEVRLLDEVDQIPALAAVVSPSSPRIGLAHTLAVTRRRRRRDLSSPRALASIGVKCGACCTSKV